MGNAGSSNKGKGDMNATSGASNGRTGWWGKKWRKAGATKITSNRKENLGEARRHRKTAGPPEAAKSCIGGGGGKFAGGGGRLKPSNGPLNRGGRSRGDKGGSSRK